MHTTLARDTSPADVAILARVLGNGKDVLPRAMARYVLTLKFGDDDSARMHDLAVRNQEDALSPEEKEELFAYARAGTVISILKSKARRVLRNRSKNGHS